MKKKKSRSKPPKNLGEQIQQVAAANTEGAAHPEIRSTEWLGALAEELGAEAEQWRGYASTSPSHQTAWLVLYSLSKAIKRTQRKCS